MIDWNPAAVAEMEETSAEYLGRWNRLVSTTNWEKGKIIQQWRDALIENNAPATEYSDEAWARRVGNLSGQHAGRLRRVFERFGSSYTLYSGLYWSHFQAAIDWEDAEMWLEGAGRDDWSVAEMRRQRAETLGLVEADEAAAEAEAAAAEPDEDFAPDAEASEAAYLGDDVSSDADDQTREHRDESEDDGAEFDMSADVDDDNDDSDEAASDDSALVATAPPVRPFADLPDLPADMAAAFESFKLAIVHHRLAGWDEVSQASVLAALDQLKTFTLLESE